MYQIGAARACIQNTQKLVSKLFRRSLVPDRRERKAQHTRISRLQTGMSVPPVLYQQSYARSPADMILTVGTEKKEIPVHRIVLFCSSPFFERLVHYNLPSQPAGTEGVLRIHLSDVSHGAMLQIVKYCYSGTVDVTSGNVEELMRVADMFVIDHVVHACQSFVESSSARSGSGRTSSQASKMKRRWNPRTG